jgi:hypothetical protein
LAINKKRQSREIFVEMHLKNRTIGAEHRNLLFLIHALVDILISSTKSGIS